MPQVLVESNSPQADMPLYPDTLSWLWVESALNTKFCVFQEKAANTSFNVLGVTQ